MEKANVFDVVVIGGGPSGATAATELARKGLHVMLLDRAGRVKPCGGAVPPRLIRDFDIPQDQIVATVKSARIISPSDRGVDMPIDEGGYVGMVDRDRFDEWLRNRAAGAGAERRTGMFERLERIEDGDVMIHYRDGTDRNGPMRSVRTRAVVGADGARSTVATQSLENPEQVPCVFAYHEIIRSPENNTDKFEKDRCDVYYQGKLSPDFYGWVFPQRQDNQRRHRLGNQRIFAAWRNP